MFVRPFLFCEGMLRLSGGAHRILGASEGDEERVALAVDLVSAVPLEGIPEQRVMQSECGRVTIGAKRLQEARRAFDIGEEQRDRADRLLHASNMTLPRTRVQRVATQGAASAIKCYNGADFPLEEGGDMHRAWIPIAISAAVLALGTAPANAATTYQLSGVEVQRSPATFVGTLANQPGIWTATILHEPLNTAPGGTTSITGGSFSITTFSPFTVVPGTITTGLITAGPVTVFNPWSCRQRFGVVGSLTAGSFAGILTHYGFPSGGGCFPLAASFVGSATL